MRKTLAGLLAFGVAVVGILLVARGPDRAPKRGPAVTATTKRHAAPAIAWPQYGFDLQRTHAADVQVRPPFRRRWAFSIGSTFIEFPPVTANGVLFLTTDRGDVLAVDAAGGRLVWRRRLNGCIASAPALGAGLLLVTSLGPAPCRSSRVGGLYAFNPRTGRLRWHVPTAPSESSALVVGNRVIFGAWDGSVYCVDLRSGRVVWRFHTAGPVKAGASYAGGTVYAASYDGHVYALALRSGRVRWRSPSLGPFYATPAVTDGRVIVGATTGVVYGLGTGTGLVVWQRHVGPFVYSAAAVARGRVYVGSYDHRLYALDAATGAIEWTFRGKGPISGAPTVLGTLVYFSTCGSCSAYESNPRARRTFAVDARTGALRWGFGDGEYSPVVSDGRSLYLAGYTTLYALTPARR